MQRKEEKTAFNFQLPKQLEEEWRSYIAKKYHGYHKGDLTKEVEAALRHFMQHSEVED